MHRLFKFPQMDFEMAIWEMTSLLIAPKKVFKSIYYHVRQPWCDGPEPVDLLPLSDMKEEYTNDTFSH
jgi:hypothetical protein